MRHRRRRLLARGARPHVLLGQGDGQVARREEDGRRRVEQGQHCQSKNVNQ